MSKDQLHAPLVEPERIHQHQDRLHVLHVRRPPIHWQYRRPAALPALLAKPGNMQLRALLAVLSAIGVNTPRPSATLHLHACNVRSENIAMCMDQPLAQVALWVKPLQL